MANMIKELRKKNKQNFPGAMDQALAALNKELVMLMQASGGAWLVTKIKEKLKKDEDENHVAEVLLQEVMVAMLCVFWREWFQGSWESLGVSCRQGGREGRIFCKSIRVHARVGREHMPTHLKDCLSTQKLPEDPFNVYWRETMRVLIRRKFGEHALSAAEMRREWSVIDHVDLSTILNRLQDLTGIKFHQSAHDKAKLIDYAPADASSAVRFSEGDFEVLGPSVKENGLALAGRGWNLMYRARALAIGKPKEQLLQLAANSLADNVDCRPNDWVANYDCGCALYDLAWASPPSRRYEIMRKAYRRFRHSHKVCPTWLASMLRLGDTVYSMTLMRQDTTIEEDYVDLCVGASDMLDHSLDYSARCGVWADQVYQVATITNGYRSQRLYSLAGVTYNEWIGLGGDPEAVGMKWLLEHHRELEVEPADIAAMVNLIRSTDPHHHGKANKRIAHKTNEQSKAQFERIHFANRHISDACVMLVSTRAPVGAVKHLDLSNTDNITGNALVALCEEHGESLESLVLTTTPKIRLPEILQSVSLCHAEGFGQLAKLHLDDIKELGDRQLQKMAAKLPKNLTSLSLKYGLNVEDAGVIEIAKSHTHLMSLNLCGCEKLTDSSILYVAHACVELEHLDVTGCLALTDESMLQFAYRTRRYYTGRKGIPGKGPYNHDDPTLVLADLVLKNRGKKKKAEDEDNEWVFDADIALSEDAEAMAAFEAERARKERVNALRREIQEKEFTKTLKSARLTLEQVQEIFQTDGDDAPEPAAKIIDLDEIAIKMGLEEPAQRERRLRDIEKSKEAAGACVCVSSPVVVARAWCCVDRHSLANCSNLVQYRWAYCMSGEEGREKRRGEERREEKRRGEERGGGE